jgi:UDP-2,4-diacetamido-2,4,6-trideoxy-beta-L-altropyranose hydrolase
MERDQPRHRTKGDVIVVRADASPEIGTGHVMRGLALAQNWCTQADGNGPARRVIFLMASTTTAIEDRLHSAGMATSSLSAARGTQAEIEETIQFASDRGAEWVVLDGYAFSPRMQGQLRSAGLRVLCIDDDGGAGDFPADIVLNHNFHARPELYSQRGTDTRLLLGPGYALLRPEFVMARPPRSIPVVARKLLVTLGGSDPARATELVFEALKEIPSECLEAVVVVGGSNPRRSELERIAATIPAQVRVVHDAPNMAELMAWADFAVASASVTTLEMASLGLPALVMVVADNQRQIAQYLDEEKLAQNLGSRSELSPLRLRATLLALAGDPEKRGGMSTRGRALVDGAGARRVVEAMNEAA